jgi:hypothetical protein
MPSTPDLSTIGNRVSLDQSYDIKTLLPKFELKSEINPGSKQISYIDFTLCINKSKQHLRNVYEYEFKKHPIFVKLISELYKNEIEYKFLEIAQVIKDPEPANKN